MRQLRYGVAGLKDPKDLNASIDHLVSHGFAQCEVQFVKEFTLKEAEARRFGEMARDNGIALSVHAPYFAQLTTKEPDRLKLHLGGLHHACKLASAMGATVVVCHPGSHHGRPPEELHEQVNANLADLGPRVSDLGVKLGLETCGKRSQFGALGDIALLVKEHPFTTVVIDYAHIHALSNGQLNTPEAMEALFGYITSQFSFEHFWPLHTHFSDNEFGPQGEIRHVPYGKGTLRISHVVQGASKFDMALTIVSEEKDPGSHVAIQEELKSTKAPMVFPARRRGDPPGAGGPVVPAPNSPGAQGRRPPVPARRPGAQDLEQGQDLLPRGLPNQGRSDQLLLQRRLDDAAVSPGPADRHAAGPRGHLRRGVLREADP